jgi:hypothetical protein
MELSTCTNDDIKPTDRAVRTERSLLPPHMTDAVLKSSSLNAFLEKCQTSECYNPDKTFSRAMKMDVQRRLIL